MKAYQHTEDGRKWLRIVPDDGLAWDEPLSGWCIVLDLITGATTYRHTDGRSIPEL